MKAGRMPLRRLLVGVASIGAAATAVEASPVAAEATVTVEVLLEPMARAEATVAAAIEAVGGRVNGSVPGHIVQAELPLGAVDAVRTAAGVRSVRDPLPQGFAIDPPAVAGPLGAYTQAFTGEGVAHTNAAAWHAAGHRGAGVKLGIIDGFDGTTWNAGVTSGDLPGVPADHTFCVVEGTGCELWDTGLAHGVAVAELIHEIAPDAELYLATAFTASDLQAAVDWFAANGVTVVNRSMGAPLDGPGDGTGPLDAVADDAVAKGMAWFNSAGNGAGRNGRRGTYYRAPFTDTDGDGWHEFVSPTGGSGLPPGGPHEDLRLTCDGYLSSSLRWNDFGDLANATDYDLFFFLEPGDYDADYDFVAAVGDPALAVAVFHPQGPGGGVAPLENVPDIICPQGLQLYVAIYRAAANNGTEGDILELMGEAPLEVWSNPYSAGYPIVDSKNPGVFAIGAVAGDHSIAYYSSEGPTNDGRIKPDFTARSGVTTNAVSRFDGTSAASPTAAALGALVLAAGLADSPAGLRAWFLDHATTDRGPAGPDNQFGHGELVLPDLQPEPTPTPTPEPTPEPTPTATSTPGGPAIVPVDPARFLDTRGEATFDGTFTAGGRAASSSVVHVPVAGRGGVPGEAVGVVANLTVIGPDAPGYATLFPCGDDPPTASHLNYFPGEVLANNAIVPLGPEGAVCVLSSAGADYTLDVNGYVPGDSPVELFAPARYLDTRSGEPIVEGPSPGLAVGADGIASVQITGRGSVPAGAAAVIVNVTAVGPEEPGFVSLYPCSGDPRAASTLNYLAGEFVPNGGVAELSPDGKLCVFTKAASELILDVAGYVPAGSTSLVTRAGARLYDSRTGSPLADGASDTVRLTPGETRTVQVAGRAGVPAGAAAALLNVGVVSPDGAGYITLYACTPTPPPTSNLNHLLGGIVRANNAVTKLSADGTVCLYSLSGADVIVDATGWLA